MDGVVGHGTPVLRDSSQAATAARVCVANRFLSSSAGHQGRPGLRWATWVPGPQGSLGTVLLGQWGGGSPASPAVSPRALVTRWLLSKYISTSPAFLIYAPRWRGACVRGVIFFKNKMAVRNATVAGTTGWLALKTRAVGTQLQNKKQTSHTQCRLGEGPSCLGGGSSWGRSVPWSLQQQATFTPSEGVSEDSSLWQPWEKVPGGSRGSEDLWEPKSCLVI